MSQAASTLGVSQSAVTEAIKALEREIGVKFFRRHPKGVSLTIEGSQFLQHARNISAAVADATRAPRRTLSEVTGRFSLAVTYTVAGYFLPAPLARFGRMYAGVKVQLYEMSRSELERRLVSGGIDLGVILVSNLGDAEEIAAEVLIQSRRRLWLPANHPLLGPRQVSLTDVAKEPYIMLTIDEADRTALRYWQQAGHRPKIAFRTSSVEAVRSLVATGAGVAILSDMVYRPWSLEGDRIEARTVVPTRNPIHRREHGLLAWGWFRWRGRTRTPDLTDPNSESTADRVSGRHNCNRRRIGSPNPLYSPSRPRCSDCIGFED